MPFRGDCRVSLGQRAARLRLAQRGVRAFTTRAAAAAAGDPDLPLVTAASAEPPDLLVAGVADRLGSEVLVEAGMPFNGDVGGTALPANHLAGGRLFSRPVSRRAHAGQP